MSGVDPNGGGPLLVSGGASAPPEGTGLTSVTAGEWDTPSTLAARVAADAAALRTALSLPAAALVAYGTGGDTAWTGWTYSETGGATARTDGSVTGGRLRLTCTAGATLSPDNATFTATIPTALRSRSWRWRARLATMTGGSSFARWVVVVDSCYLSIRSDGVVNSGGPSISDAASSAGVVPTDGTGWIDATHESGQTTLRYGTGTASAEPTSWTVGVAYRHAQHTAEPSALLFRLEEFGSPGTTLTLEMDHGTVGPTEDGGW